MTELEVSINHSEKKKNILKKSLNFSKKVFNILKKLNFKASNKSHTRNNRNDEDIAEDIAEDIVEDIVEDNVDQTSSLNDDLFIEASVEDNTFRIRLNLENAANYLFEDIVDSHILVQFGKNREDEEDQTRNKSKRSRPRIRVSL